MWQHYLKRGHLLNTSFNLIVPDSLTIRMLKILKQFFLS